MDSITLSRRARRRALELVARTRSPHIGSVFSCMDILAVLYADILETEADGFILSKGHAALGLYAILTEMGTMSEECLETFGGNGSPLTGHVNGRGISGIDFSTGSLGHGLPAAAGMALTGRPTFVLLGDGECQEGTTWETAMFAADLALESLTVIVDVNGLQGLGPTGPSLSVSSLMGKWLAFGWEAIELDGHDHPAIREALEHASSRPKCLVARTVKGKGVSFMENEVLWHYKSPDEQELAEALRELSQ